MSDIPPPIPPPRGLSCLVKGIIGLVVVALIAGGLWWWFNRPIQPVVLTPPELATVEGKMLVIHPSPAPPGIPEPVYEKGGNEIILTERELNGLLNERTELGRTLKFELATNAVHARVDAPLDPNLPFVGGRRLRARARFLVSDDPARPMLVLDDVTVWGISLPNEWLGGLKGQDLLGQTLGGGQSGRIPGVEDVKIESGRLIIKLAE